MPRRWGDAVRRVDSILPRRYSSVWTKTVPDRACPDLGHRDRGHGESDDVMVAVVRDGDAVQALDIDGVGTWTGDASSAPQATQLGVGFTTG